MNLEGWLQGPVRGQCNSIPLQEFNSALAELEFRSAQWYHTNYSDTYRICIESPASRQFLLTMLQYLTGLQRSGGDFSVPLVLLAATMLETGFTIGRKRAETEVLEGWMKL